MKYLIKAYNYLLSRDVLGLLLSLIFLGHAKLFHETHYGYLYGTYVFLDGTGPFLSRLFLGLALVTAISSLRRISPNNEHICPVCGEVCLTSEPDACCPRCKVPLVLLSGYAGKLDLDPPEAGKTPVLSAPLVSYENHVKPPDPRQITPIWLVAISIIPFAFLLRHFSTMTLQSFAVLAFWLTFFLRRALLRSTMAMDKQRRDVLKKRLVRIMIAAVLFSVINCALLDRIVTWIS